MFVVYWKPQRGWERRLGQYDSREAAEQQATRSNARPTTRHGRWLVCTLAEWRAIQDGHPRCVRCGGVGRTRTDHDCDLSGLVDRDPNEDEDDDDDDKH